MDNGTMAALKYNLEEKQQLINTLAIENALLIEAVKEAIVSGKMSEQTKHNLGEILRKYKQ